MITVKFFATLREITGRRDMKVEGVSTVGELLQILYRKFGEEFRREVENKNMILVNGKNIVHLDGYDTRIQDGDVISIFPPVGGG